MGIRASHERKATRPRKRLEAARALSLRLTWRALLLPILAIPGPARGQISLGSAVELAQRESSAVKLAGSDLRKASALLAESKDVYYPNLTFGSSIGPPSIGFPAGQPSVANAAIQSLAFSVQQRKYIQAANAGIQAAQLSLKEAREQVALDVSSEYIELDTVARELEATEEQSALSSRLVEIESERRQAGVDSMNDLLQARLTAAELRLKHLHLESRAASLIAQLASLTGLPTASIQTVHASIPEIPAIGAKDGASEPAAPTAGLQAAQAEARSRQLQAQGDELATKIRPLIAFGAIYNRDATSLNNYNIYFGKPGTKFKADNFSAGFSIQIPIFDMNHRAKARESEAESLRSVLESEQAQRQNDVQIATLTGSLRELDALAEVATLKQQIAAEQLKTVQAELTNGNGAGVEPGAPPQPSPKAGQLARIDERQKYVEALDAGFDLARTRLTLLRALGHMEDWLSEVRAGLTAKEPPPAAKR